MNTDSCFQIGKDHKICEDYAISGINNDIAYAIVCDGCSASNHVDIGARLLALAARENIFNKIVERFGYYTIYNCGTILTQIPFLNVECLDATLLTAVVTDKNLFVQMYGDGVMIHKTKDIVNVVHIHLTSGAPDYLSYYLDNKRKESYDDLKDNKKEIQIVVNGKEDLRIYAPFNPFIYECEVNEGDTISVISDGINSFRKSDNESIDWKELVDEFTSFKNFEGEFVLRRISAFKRKCLKENIHHLDDISIASIVV